MSRAFRHKTQLRNSSGADCQRWLRRALLLSFGIGLQFYFSWHSCSAQDLRSPTRYPNQIVFRQQWSWQEIRVRNIVMQQKDYSCGAAALATIMRYGLGDNVNEMSVLRAVDQVLTQEELQDRVKNGLTLTDLRRVAVKMGYVASIGTVKASDLTTSKIPLVVGIIDDGYDHFVVVRGVSCGWIFLADPMRGNIRLPLGVFQSKWQ